jgi:dihydrodipicolinate synthase/N-acetylneuraminate lyase
MKKLRGQIPPMVTPFDRDGNICESSVAQLVQFLNARVQGLFVCGSYGGGPLMSVAERKSLVEIVSKNIASDVELVVHVGTTNTRDSVDLSKHAQAHGASRVAAVAPYYFQHSADNIKRFFERLVEAVDIPVYFYNNPKLTGFTAEVDFVRDLKNIGVVGMKDSSFDIVAFERFQRELGGDDFDIVLGTEAMLLSAAALGAQAFIPGLGNAFPEICGELFEAAMSGDLQRARKAQADVNKLRDIMYLAKSTVVAVYSFLKIRDVCEAFPREPFLPLEDEELALLETELHKLGVL